MTAEVAAQEQARQAYALLEDEKGRTDALLLRQNDLIECLGWVGDVGRAATLGSPRSAKLFDSFRQQLTAGGGKLGGDDVGLGMEGEPAGAQANDTITVLQLIGEGSVSQKLWSAVCTAHVHTDQYTPHFFILFLPPQYGKVYKALWRGIEVAVKSMFLPLIMSGAQKRGRLAIMEAAISSSLSHPNLIRTYTYTLTPVHQPASPIAEPSSLASLDPSSSSASQERVSLEGQSKSSSNPSNTPSSKPLSPHQLPPSTKPLSALQGPGPVTAFQVQLVLELCDLGTLRGALDAGALCGDSGACLAVSLKDAEALCSDSGGCSSALLVPLVLG